MLGVNRYDEYGIPQSSNVGRFQYTGQAWLAELGMYYYKARIYSPTLGRFLQTDPIGYDGGANLYAYAGGDPVNGIDPDGLAPLWLGGDGGFDGIEGSRMGGTRIENPFDRLVRRIGTRIRNANAGEKRPTIGHNGGPSLGDGTKIPDILRAPAIALIGCIFACKGPSVHAQILRGDLIRSSTREGFVPKKWEVRRVRGRDFDSDWAYLASHAERVYLAPNGNWIAQMQNYTVTRYVSRSGGEPTLSMTGPSGTIKFRYDGQ